MNGFDAAYAAVIRLLAVAAGGTGQSRQAASFLLAWWNARSCGGFDPTDLWSVDDAIADDMLIVLRLIATSRIYPTSIGLDEQFAWLVRKWRPELIEAPD